MDNLTDLWATNGFYNVKKELQQKQMDWVIDDQTHRIKTHVMRKKIRNMKTKQNMDWKQNNYTKAPPLKVFVSSFFTEMTNKNHIYVYIAQLTCDLGQSRANF